MASSGNQNVALYDGYCPNDKATLVNLAWKDHTEFEVSVFKLADSDQLTFSCTVRMYPDEGDLPTDCTIPEESPVNGIQTVNEVDASGGARKRRHSGQDSIIDDLVEKGKGQFYQTYIFIKNGREPFGFISSNVDMVHFDKLY